MKQRSLNKNFNDCLFKFYQSEINEFIKNKITKQYVKKYSNNIYNIVRSYYYLNAKKEWLFL